MFAVVQFITESTNDNVSVSEVPALWISDDRKQCWWPPSNTGIYIARQKKPNPDTWKLHPIKFECFCETYQEAKKKALALTSSDEETLSRTLKPNQKYNPDQFELNYVDEPNNNSEISLPIAPMSLTTLNPISQPISTTDELNQDTRSISTINSEPIILDISEYRPNNADSPVVPESELSVESQIQNAGNNHSNHSCCKNSDVIIQLLTEMNLKITELKETIGNTQASIHVDQLNHITNKLPCKNIEELEDLESLILTNIKQKESLIYFMTSIGGTSGKDFTQRVLKKMFTNELAEICSWTGAKHNFEIRNLTILECAYISVIRHYQITRKEFEMHVKDWLRHARQRRERENMKKKYDSDMYMEENQPADTRIPEYQPQDNIFHPSFPSYQEQPSGHSRPFYQQQEGAYSHRPQGAYQQRFDYDAAKYVGYKDRAREAASENVGVLGSGNFGVIKGGTFYQENEAAAESSNFDEDFSSYYQNGHGRPSFYYNQNPRPYQHEQFANFRDFADINTPSYSQYIVVYANKNDSSKHPAATIIKRRPNNIFESLTQLDLTAEDDATTTTIPPKKLSKSKRKLALLPKEKKIRIKKTEILEKKAQNEASEPLLALS